MAGFRQALTVLLLPALCAVAAGCGIPRSVGLAERCADMMQRAYPSAAIEVRKSEASAVNLTTIVAKAEGVRTDLPADAPLPHELAVECRFDQSILTEFRWTAGPMR